MGNALEHPGIHSEASGPSKDHFMWNDLSRNLKIMRNRCFTVSVDVLQKSKGSMRQRCDAMPSHFPTINSYETFESNASTTILLFAKTIFHSYRHHHILCVATHRKHLLLSVCRHHEQSIWSQLVLHHTTPELWFLAQAMPSKKQSTKCKMFANPRIVHRKCRSQLVDKWSKGCFAQG